MQKKNMLSQVKYTNSTQKKNMLSDLKKMINN